MEAFTESERLRQLRAPPAKMAGSEVTLYRLLPAAAEVFEVPHLHFSDDLRDHPAVITSARCRLPMQTRCWRK